jgi:hypothetical protein
MMAGVSSRTRSKKISMAGVSSRTRSKNVPLFGCLSLNSSMKRKKNVEVDMGLDSVPSGSKRKRVKDEPKNPITISVGGVSSRTRSKKVLSLDCL